MSGMVNRNKIRPHPLQAISALLIKGKYLLGSKMNDKYLAKFFYAEEKRYSVLE